MAKPRALKITAISVLALIVLLVIVVALLPAMVNRGLGHGMIRSAIEDQINGTADFQQVRVTWFGPQTMTGLSIVDHVGHEAAMLDVSVTQGLFPLLFGTALDATVAGVVRGEVYEDGTVSFQRLAVERPPRDEPPDLEGMPPTTVTVERLTAHLLDVASQQQYTINDLRGQFVYVPGDDLRFDLQGETLAGEERGSITARGGAPGLFDSRGRFTPEGSPLNIELAVQSIPMPGVDVQSLLHELTFSAQSQNVAELVALNMAGQATIQQEQPSRFRGEFRIRRPIQPDGTIDLSLERIEGELAGESVPSSLLQPAFNATPIVLRRDIGSVVDVDVQLNPGLEGMTVVRATGERATVDLAAMYREEDGWWVGDRFNISTAMAHPDLVEGFTGLRIEEPTDLEIALTSFAIPPIDTQIEARPWAMAGASGALRVTGPAHVLLELDENPDTPPVRVALSNTVLNIDSAQIGDVLYVDGSMQIDGGDVSLEYAITDLGDAEGRIAAANARPVGTLTVANLPGATAGQFVPDQAETIAELLGAAINATVETALVEDGLEARVAATGEAMEANLHAVRTEQALRLVETRATLTLTPALADALLRDLMEEPVQVTQPARLQLALRPAEFPGTPPFDYEIRGVPLTGTLSLDDLVLTQVPGIDEPVGLTEVAATLNAQLDEQWSYALDGGASLQRALENRQIAAITYDISATPRENQPMALSGTLALANINLADAEGMLGQQPGGFTRWVGDNGSLTARLTTVEDRYEATLDADLQRLTGTFAASMTDELVSLNTEAASLNLAAATLANLLAAENDAAAVEVLEDVPLTLALQSRFPLAMIQQEPFQPTLVDVDARMTGGPIVLVSEGERSTLSDVVMVLRSEIVGDDVDFILTIDADISESPVTAQAGEIDVQGRVRQLMTRERAFNFDTAHVNLDASVVRAPAVFVDAILNMRGLLVAAIGREISATIDAQDFSRNSGTLAMDIEALHGWLRATGAGSDGLLVFAEGSPLEAELELTPLLRDRLLRPLHPLLGDILDLHQPLHAMISNASLPMDGDISRLNADIELTLGEVDFDPRSDLFALLRVARVADVRRIDGFVEPITAHIRNGVVNYDRFNVTVRDIAMPYEGRIDLTTGQVQLRTVLPLGEVVTGIREIPAEARMIQVPLVTRGTFANLETQIDPEFDLARAMLEAGVRDRLEDIIPRDRLPFDLRDILPRRR